MGRSRTPRPAAPGTPPLQLGQCLHAHGEPLLVVGMGQHGDVVAPPVLRRADGEGAVVDPQRHVPELLRGRAVAAGPRRPASSPRTPWGRGPGRGRARRPPPASGTPAPGRRAAPGAGAPSRRRPRRRSGAAGRPAGRPDGARRGRRSGTAAARPGSGPGRASAGRGRSGPRGPAARRRWRARTSTITPPVRSGELG